MTCAARELAVTSDEVVYDGSEVGRVGSVRDGHREIL
jgi:hypothetical protein